MFISIFLYFVVLFFWVRVIVVSVYCCYLKWIGLMESIFVFYWIVRGLDKDECY